MQREYIEDISTEIAQNFEQINLDYISSMAEHIRDIGKLTDTDIYRLDQLRRMYANIGRIEDALTMRSGISLMKLRKLWHKQAATDYKAAKDYYKAGKVVQIPLKDNVPIQNLLTSIERQTAHEFTNIARTTINNASYVREIDRAILAVTTGGSRRGEIERIIRQKAARGLRVGYAGTNWTQRLDSALFRTIGDGFRALAREQQRLMGDEFGADGIEIDAHGLCAEDHQPYQGKQYPLNKFFDDSGAQIMDTGRDIGDLNCRHGITYIIMGVHDPVYSDKQLKRFKELSNEKVDILGRSMTRYEASQKMRQIETQIRYTKESMLAGVTDADKQRLANLRSMYDEVSEAADIGKELERTLI